MLQDFNLLISTRRGEEKDACSEVWYLLREVGDSEALVDPTPIRGLVVAKTKLNPFEAVEKLRKLLNERPEEFRYVLKIIPIQKVVKTSLDEIRQVAKEFSSLIGLDEKFRVSVEKRHSEMDRMEIVKVAAEEIDRKVDLKNPDKILLIEVLGNLTGISVIRETDILSVVKEKKIIF
ncbi:RNA methyltransferase [Candidatus Bathyarchaeota archaeon]|nr:MAG: RNA methyltransferase [Candidatus Bathyarchaeota archaeon]